MENIFEQLAAITNPNNKYFNTLDYAKYLKDDNFNDEQIKFLIEQRNIYESSLTQTERVICNKCGKESNENYFDADTYEREMWYTMNRSGLFEDSEENKTDITDWTVNHTRIYITEINI